MDCSFRHSVSGFLRNSQNLPDQPALILGPQTYTYAQLRQLAGSWANLLLDVGGKGGRKLERVGIFAARCEESYVGVLAALLAGATFVPLNPKLPDHRTRDMIERADLDALIVGASAATRLTAIAADGSLLPTVLAPRVDAALLLGALPQGQRVLGKADVDARGARGGSVCVDAIGPADIAYLLFTSGSTGTPKGVPITHGNLRAFLDFNLERYGLGPDDRLTQTFEQTFDLSVFDLFMAWESGACVCAIDPIELLAPAEFLKRNKVSVWFSVPSVARLLQTRKSLRKGCFPTLRWSLFCGESLPRDVAEAWAAAAPASTIENLYGPTELTIACSVYRWNPQTSPDECLLDSVPIGEVYRGLSHMVVNEALEELTEGETGELCVGGPQTSPGYWRAPELTEARFFEWETTDGSRRFYRTGDLVRRIDDRYVFVGRSDQQVKIGGHRVELGEVESVLRRLGWAEAVALPWPDAAQAVSIIGIVTKSSAKAQAKPVLRLVKGVAEDARKHLAGYMVPRQIFSINAMPLNVNGKIDRKALASMVATRLASAVKD
jgi:amino acid adenylation domain-containing protein